MNCYRIVEVKDGKVMSLFHGTQGSRVLPIGKWLTADAKIVSDGSCATKYRSGFHVFKDSATAHEFFGKMFRKKDGRVIVAVQATGLRRKAHARGEVYLARRMKVLSVAPVEKNGKAAG